MTEHRVLPNDRFQLVSTSSEVQTLFARVLVRHDDGTVRRFRMGARVTNATRAPQTRLFGLVTKPGVVERAQVIAKAPAKRGRTYVELAVKDDEEDATQDLLLQDYVAANLQPSLNRFHEAGPGGGTGFKNNRPIADDIAPATITHTLGETNHLRRIDGFIWYYHCSGDVASRALRATVRDLGDGLPTGMTSGIRTSIKNYPSAGVLTLTANEEGVIYVNAATGKSFAASIDDSALTIEDITTQPDPFPYWSGEGDVGELFFLLANEEAADRHTIYIIEEDWIYV